MDNVRDLSFQEQYNGKTQAELRLIAASLDDQLKLLKKDISDLNTEHLEWPAHPGMNTVGMLLAHLAVVEVWWMNLAAEQIKSEEDADRISVATIGIRMDDDGLPAKEGVTHPEPIRGKSLADYLQMIDNARAETHRMLLGWTDADMERVYKHPMRGTAITVRWTLYHILEHFSGHYGQILLLKHLMRDAGLLPKKEKN